MSKQNGGIIGPNNIPTGAFGSASGVWKLSDAINYKRQGTWPIALSGHQVANSARFETNTYMKKTASSGNTKTFTISFWCKRANLATGNNQFPISFYQDSSNRISVALLTDNTFIVYAEVGGSTKMNLITNRVFRDTSAWMHFFIKVDTTQGTEANRVKLYINGTQETSFSTATYPSQNQDLIINTNVYVGTYDTSNNFYNGYMAESVYIDGTAYDSTSFGEFDSQTGIWVPKNVNGLTAGTNGFYLNFEDSSNLGNDVFGGTDLTEYNFTSIDQSTDTCTNNFATLNPLDNYYCAGTFSDGNNTIVTGSSEYSYVTGTLGVSQGKWYYEAKAVATGSSNTWYSIGWSGNSPSGTTVPLGNQPDSVSYQGQNGTIRINGSETSTGTTFTTGDIIGTALDLDNNLVYFYKNGTLVNLGGTAITASASTTNGVWCPAVGDFDSSGTKTWSTDFGSPVYAISSGNVDSSGLGNFEYAVPEGFYSICTKNLNLIG
jgi:hypothetical protein